MEWRRMEAKQCSGVGKEQHTLPGCSLLPSAAKLRGADLEKEEEEKKEEEKEEEAATADPCHPQRCSQLQTWRPQPPSIFFPVQHASPGDAASGAAGDTRELPLPAISRARGHGRTIPPPCSRRAAQSLPARTGSYRRQLQQQQQEEERTARSYLSRSGGGGGASREQGRCGAEPTEPRPLAAARSRLRPRLTGAGRERRVGTPIPAGHRMACSNRGTRPPLRPCLKRSQHSP